MIKVLFKSKELLIAADSESAVVYGNTTKNTVIEYLSNLTPKNGEDAIGIIMLIMLLTKSKYVVAKQIKVTTKTEVVVKLLNLQQLRLLRMHFVLLISSVLKQKCKESLIMALHHQKLLKSGISFDDCFSPEQDFKLLTFYQLKI